MGCSDNGRMGLDSEAADSMSAASFVISARSG
jgi:hypothetical protein